MDSGGLGEIISPLIVANIDTTDEIFSLWDSNAHVYVLVIQDHWYLSVAYKYRPSVTCLASVEKKRFNYIMLTLIFKIFDKASQTIIKRSVKEFE
jgi:hypothetical protein